MSGRIGFYNSLLPYLSRNAFRAPSGVMPFFLFSNSQTFWASRLRYLFVSSHWWADHLPVRWHRSPHNQTTRPSSSECGLLDFPKKHDGIPTDPSCHSFRTGSTLYGQLGLCFSASSIILLNSSGVRVSIPCSLHSSTNPLINTLISFVS